jgi:hypothetical protein
VGRSGVDAREYQASDRHASARPRRSRLYRLLAAAHSGPLRQELTGIIKITASSLFEGERLPDVPTASPAELYRQVYGLGAGYPRVMHPLPAKLLHLAWSAGREAQGRAHEAAYIRPTPKRRCSPASTVCSSGRRCWGRLGTTACSRSHAPPHRRTQNTSSSLTCIMARGRTEVQG